MDWSAVAQRVWELAEPVVVTMGLELVDVQYRPEGGRTVLRLLIDRPLHDISVDDLAKGAGLSRPAFYFYFASKEQVLLKLLDRLVEEQLQDERDYPGNLADDPARVWRHVLGASHARWSAEMFTPTSPALVQTRYTVSFFSSAFGKNRLKIASTR